MMQIMLKSKLHRARVTDADLNYMGSITIDQDLMEKAGIATYERVQVVNNNNGARFETYVIPGEKGSKTICLNGAAARLAQKGDIVIIMAYVLLDKEEMIDWQPKILLLDKGNNVVEN